MTLSTVPYALVVDDNALILMDACDILDAAGFRFYEASTGDTTKLLLADHAEEVTLLFSDVEMPGDTDGFARARHVAVHWPWIEIVIVSGNAEPGPGSMPAKATFLRKPFSRETIHTHLRNTLPDHLKPAPLRRMV